MGNDGLGPARVGRLWNPDCGNGTTVTQVAYPIKASSIYCEEARRLLNAFADAIHELVQVHEQQFNAIILGDLDCTQFDLSIHEANKAKYAAKYAYLGHLEEHGCSNLESEAATGGR